jgi:hypothetical protein
MAAALPDTRADPFAALPHALALAVFSRLTVRATPALHRGLPRLARDAGRPRRVAAAGLDARGRQRVQRGAASCRDF